MEAFYPFIADTLSENIFFKHFFVKAMKQMELNQIFVFTKWRLLILLYLLPYLISLSLKLFCEGNEPNGLESNICFNKVKGFYPFNITTLSDIIIFKIIFCSLTKWRLFIHLLLLFYLILLSSKLFCVGNEPNEPSF